ncbi:MAG: hypothetical protein PUA69_06335 [Erysipelotrichaceae bacterium]|nr:hypothetical protein [Erysipelotrichaceae bacterium]
MERAETGQSIRALTYRYKNARFISHTSKGEFSGCFLINETFHRDVTLDKNTFIQHLLNELISPNSKKEKITDSQLLADNDLHHIECDCYEKDKIIVKIAEGVLFLKRPSDDNLLVKIKRLKVQMRHVVKEPLKLCVRWYRQ